MRPIDADALDKEFTRLRFDDKGELRHWGDRKDWCLHGHEIDELIANAPTIEAEPNTCKYWDSESHFCALRRPQAEPVRRGRWLINKEDGWISIAPCSVCGGVQDIDFPYCPNCGARMEEEE